MMDRISMTSACSRRIVHLMAGVACDRKKRYSSIAVADQFISFVFPEGQDHNSTLVLWRGHDYPYYVDDAGEPIAGMIAA